MAGTTGLEPATSDVTGRRSNQLNYVPALFELAQHPFLGPRAQGVTFGRFKNNTSKAGLRLST